MNRLLVSAYWAESSPWTPTEFEELTIVPGGFEKRSLLLISAEEFDNHIDCEKHTVHLTFPLLSLCKLNNPHSASYLKYLSFCFITISQALSIDFEQVVLSLLGQKWHLNFNMTWKKKCYFKCYYNHYNKYLGWVL